VLTIVTVDSMLARFSGSCLTVSGARSRFSASLNPNAASGSTVAGGAPVGVDAATGAVLVGAATAATGLEAAAAEPAAIAGVAAAGAAAATGGDAAADDAGTLAVVELEVAPRASAATAERPNAAS
jgi:hypothetical protein